MKSVWIAALLALGLVTHSAHAENELHAPYAEAAFGVGFFTLKALLDDGRRTGDFGTLFMGDLRLFPLSSHGAGLRLSGLSGASLFGTVGAGAFSADVFYALRRAPASGFHPVPSLILGPSYFAYSAAGSCETTCVDDEVHLDSHHAVGGVLGLALDFHGGGWPFGGLELNGHYLFPLASNGEREWMIQFLARFGGTFSVRKRDDANKTDPPPQRWR